MPKEIGDANAFVGVVMALLGAFPFAVGVAGTPKETCGATWLAVPFVLAGAVDVPKDIGERKVLLCCVPLGVDGVGGLKELEPNVVLFCGVVEELVFA